MVTMTVEDVIGIYTITDLEQAREHERHTSVRWELLEGELVVTPSPRPVHQRGVTRLILHLDPVLPPGLEVMASPLDIQVSSRTVLQPDVVILRHEQIGHDGVNGVPVLVVEVLSPSTRRRDLVHKRGVLERAGCPHYWVLDPDGMSLWVWRLVEGAYVLEHHVTGAEEVRLTVPVEVTLRVSDLLGPPADPRR